MYSKNRTEMLNGREDIGTKDKSKCKLKMCETSRYSIIPAWVDWTAAENDVKLGECFDGSVY